VNLEPFCAPSIPQLREPFSIGDFTYAANGHIMVRIPRRPGIPEADKDWRRQLEGGILANLTAALADRSYGPLPLYGDHPGTPPTECGWCDGSGKVVKCADCDGDGEVMCGECGGDRECETCEGCGSVPSVAADAQACRGCNGSGRQGIARYPTHDFDIKYIAMISALPDLQVAFGTAPANWRDRNNFATAMTFRFDGGVGVLMPMDREEADDASRAA